jgi:ATP-dependent Lon protease
MAYDYLKANSGKIGIDRDLASYDMNIMVTSLMQGKDTGDIGIAFYIGMISSLLGRPVGYRHRSALSIEHSWCVEPCRGIR